VGSIAYGRPWGDLTEEEQAWTTLFALMEADGFFWDGQKFTDRQRLKTG
jgi:hypothetical protein